MPVEYGGFDLIPAPLISISKTFTRDENDVLVQSGYQLTLTGTLVNIDTDLDSPGASGYTGLRGIIGAQEYLTDLFDGTAKRLHVTAPEGSTGKEIDCYARAININFTEGVWVNRCDYSITLEADYFESDPAPSGIESFNETWSINENQNGIFSISHNLEARGRKIYHYNGNTNDPLQDAMDWVSSRTFDNAVDDTSDIGSLVLDSNGNVFNKARVENIDSANNSYSLTENFVYISGGTTTESFNVNITKTADTPNRIIINIDGEVVGYAFNESDSATKYSNAMAYYTGTIALARYSRAADVADDLGYVLNPHPVTENYSVDRNTGTIRWGASFQGTSGYMLIRNAIEENIDVNDTGTTDVFALIEIPGRQAGPIVQPMATYTLPERTVNITAKIITASGYQISADTDEARIATLRDLYSGSYRPDVEYLLDALAPSGAYYYVKANTENWNPIRGEYDRSVTWQIQPEENAYFVEVPHASGLSNPSPSGV